MPGTIALIVAAGSGERVGGALPKQYRKLAGKPVLRWAVEAFTLCPAVDSVRVVIRSSDELLYRAATTGLPFRPPIPGGATRQDSVRRGLEALVHQSPDRVLIHDAARPFISTALVGRVLDALDDSDAAAPMLPVVDTLRRKEATTFELVPRDELFRTQTPQAFRFDKILAAHRKFVGDPATDDIALAERVGLSIASVAGEETNFKLTTEDDFILAERLAGSSLSDIRTGMGFDVHRFAPGDHVWLCGVKVRHDFGLEGHSDADAGLHALTDAILGAVGAGDIGVHFPPNEERWKGAPSHLFLEHAARLVREIGGVISHVDITLICERPKVTPHRQDMRARIAEILGVDIVRVSVKATTTEGLGFTGRREGIAAQAVATIRLPPK